MTKTEAVERILQVEPQLRLLGVKSLLIFGSVARGDSTDSSDLDLIAEFELPHTFRQYIDTLLLLEDHLHVHVDLAEPQTLHPKIRARVLAEAIKVA